MKRENIKLILGIAIGIIISGITAFAINISSANINYDNTNSGLEATTVEGAINELYQDASKKMALNTFGNALYSQNLTTYTAGDNDTYLSLTKGKYIVSTLYTYVGTNSVKGSENTNDIDTANLLQCSSNNCVINDLSKGYYYKTATSTVYSNTYLEGSDKMIVFYVDIKNDNDTIVFKNTKTITNAACPTIYAIQAIPINE